MFFLKLFTHNVLYILIYMYILHNQNKLVYLMAKMDSYNLQWICISSTNIWEIQLIFNICKDHSLEYTNIKKTKNGG